MHSNNIYDLLSMSNKKRKVTFEDYELCYHYFNRAIQNNRFMKGELHDNLRDKAVQSFVKLKISSPNQECLNQFQLWVDEFVDSSAWARCYRALNQKKYLVENGQRTITISDKAYNALKNLTNEKNISLSELILEGCSTLQKNDDEPVKASGNIIKIDALVSNDIASALRTSPNNLIKPPTLGNNNVVSLFEEEGIDLFDDDDCELDLEYNPFCFDDIPELPLKPEGYDFRKNESYKTYRKKIKQLTIKKSNEELLGYFTNTINYSLTEDNCHQVGAQLISIRNELLLKDLFTREFNPEAFSISKGINLPNLTMDDYEDELIFLLGYIFGCSTPSITAGNRQPTVFAGHPNHVQLAYKTYHYLDGFLRDEVNSFKERCHKNTKRKNRITKAKWHGCHLVSTMLNSVLDDSEDYKLLQEPEYEKLSKYSFANVYEYFDENEPIGGWRDPKKQSAPLSSFSFIDDLF